MGRITTHVLLTMTIATVWLAPLGAQSAAPRAAATPAERPFAVEEYGRVSCQQFIAARAQRTAPAYNRIMGFVQGYLTAANRYEPDTFDLSPWHNAAAFDLILEKHCSAQPNEPLVVVLQKMVGAFRPMRVAKASAMVKVSNDKGTAYVYDTVLRRSETYLKARGFYAGPINGADSPALREAFAKFQQDKGFTPTGIPDPATLWTLLNP